MPRKTRTPDALQKASDHLVYEYWMLNASAEKLERPSLDKVTTNALIESFTVHARVLISFLFKEGTIKENDVIAEDFFAEIDYKDYKKMQSIVRRTLEKIEVPDRVGKQVVHLTYSRQETTLEKKIWQIGAIRQSLNVAMNNFLKCVSHGLLGERWKTADAKELDATISTRSYPAHWSSIPMTIGSTAPAGGLMTSADTVNLGVLRVL